MKQQKYHWVCTYDVSQPRRLAKIHRLLAMQGLALNYSVFYLYLDNQEYQKLHKALLKLVTIEDDVRLYRCAALHTANCIGDLTPAGINLINEKGIFFSD